MIKTCTHPGNIVGKIEDIKWLIFLYFFIKLSRNSKLKKNKQKFIILKFSWFFQYFLKE